MKNFTNSSDEHHCRCFKINSDDIEICKKRLIELGFEVPIAEEPRGQVFGLRYRLLELLQMHFKVMPNGIIETELEPPPEYPGAHLNSVHSYPAHDATPILLEHAGIEYTIIQFVPDSCHLPKIVDPKNPLKWWEMLIIGLAVVGLGSLIVKVLKS